MEPAAQILKMHMEHLSKKLYIHKLVDWYSISKPLVKWAGYQRLLKQYSSIENLVRATYPEHAWDHEEFRRGQRAQMGPQKLLSRIVTTLFPPPNRVQFNARNPSHGFRGNSGRFLEIDVFLPDLKLGFEYQDELHYFRSKSNVSGTLEEYQERDQMKCVQAQEKGITLLVIPFWWNWDVRSLISTIKQRRSDLLGHLPPLEGDAAPIPSCPPAKVLHKYNADIPGFGMPMLAMYAPQTQSFDPTNWLIFEKFDGSRTIWNCNERRFYSRWGSIFPIPNYISDTMPHNHWLDAEIWFGREKGMRYQSTKLINTAAHLVLWSKFQLVVFDVPSASMLRLPYVQRYELLSSSVLLRSIHGHDGHHPYVQLAKYSICTGRPHVETLFFNIRAQGGEGVILRDPSAPYVHGYSRFLYKHKGFRDAEALVVRQTSASNFLCKVSKHYETGVHSIRMSADRDHYYFVEMSVDASTFGDDASEEKIAAGQFVSFRYITNDSGGPPLNPKIYTIRHDVHSLEPQGQPNMSERGEEELAAPNTPSTLQHHHKSIWKPRTQTSWRSASSHKAYFDSFARQKHFDPLVAENWYKVSESELASEASFLQTYYSHSVKTALMAVYPDIGLNPRKFSVIPKHHWQSMENKRLFFEECAAAMHMDPLQPENWYPVSPTSFFKAFPKVWALAKPFGGSLAKTLIHVFPFIGLQQHLFKALPYNHYATKENRRRVFDEFAATHGFDALVHSNWYRVTPSMMRSRKGGRAVMRYYESVLLAVSDLYQS